MKKLNRKGFTLIELLAVIVILAAAAAGYYLYSQGYFGGSSDDSQPVAETTVLSADVSGASSEAASEENTENSESAEDTLSETNTESSEDTASASSETTEASSESASDTSAADDTETVIAAENLSDISLTFAHAQSVGGSEILTYTLADSTDDFSISDMTEASQLIVDYTAAVSGGNNISPVNMYISDGTSKEVVPASSVTETQVIYDYSVIRETAEALGFADGINGIVSISFSGVGFPVDITSMIVTNCI